MEKAQLRRRFWIEAGLASLSGLLFALTLVTREWIELLFGVDPDGGSGALEWGSVVVLVGSTVGFGVLARAEWRRGAAGAAA
jgi:hypothetical protein